MILSKKRNKVLSLVLCLVIFSIMLPVQNIPVFASSTVTLQQGTDGYNLCKQQMNIEEIASNQSQSWQGNGAAQTFFMGTYYGSPLSTLIYFDISQIPANAVIDSATLSFNLYGGYPSKGAHKLYRVTDTDSKGMWVQGGSMGGASWVRRDGSGAAGNITKGWTNTSISTIHDSVDLNYSSVNITDTTANTWASADVKSDIQQWVSGTQVNEGWYFTGEGGTSLKAEFASINYSDISRRPKLEIQYHDPNSTPDPTPQPTETPSQTPSQPPATTPVLTTPPVTGTVSISPSPTKGTPTPAPTTNPSGGKTYYVSSDPAKGNDTNDGLSYDRPKFHLVTASRLLFPGDTLILEGGIYGEGEYIWPYNNGTSSKPITIKAADGESPVLYASADYYGGKVMGALSYYEFDGLTFKNLGDYSFAVTNATGLVIKNCTFINNGMVLTTCHYVTIENNYMDTAGNLSAAGVGANISLNGCDHTVIANNYISKGGHSCLDCGASGTVPPLDNVIRNNLFNVIWSTGISLMSKYRTRNIVEDNEILYSGAYMPGYPKSGINLLSNDSIYRRNIIGWTGDGKYNNYPQSAIGIYTDVGYTNNNSINNKFYNNVIYKTGYMAISGYEKSQYIIDKNQFFNNIFYNNHTIPSTANRYQDPGNWCFGWMEMVGNSRGDDYLKWNTPQGYFRKNEMYNNIMLYADSSGNDKPNEPIFYYDGAAISGASWGKTLDQMEAYTPQIHDNYKFNPGFEDADSGDFRLKSDSQAIDAGAHFTKTSNTATVTTNAIPVADATYFYDGYGISGEKADVLKIGSNDNVQITSIDYVSNIINISSDITINPGDNVDLMYSGSAPDLGAYEYNQPSAVPPTIPQLPTPTPAAPPTPTPVAAAAKVVFYEADSSSKGSWKGLYGSDGFDLVTSSSLPDYTRHISYSGCYNYTSSVNTSDVRAIQKPNSDTERQITGYYGDVLTIDLTIASSTPKLLTMYFLDWDKSGRAQKVEASDPVAGTVLDTQVISNFNDGVYLRYYVRGHVKFTISKDSGGNTGASTIVNGLFFDTSEVYPTDEPTPSPTLSPSPTLKPTKMPTPTPTKKPTATPVISPASTPSRYIDVPDSHWAKEYIDLLSAAGIIHGYDDGTFRPGNNISRAEFAAMITGAYNIISSTATASFTDVSSDKWYYKYIASAEKEGLITGKGEGIFAPESAITREEMFTINVRALEKYNSVTILSSDDPETASRLVSFADGAAVSGWARGYVATNVKIGLVTGKEENGQMMLHPIDPITRAEVATVLGKNLKQRSGA